MTNRFAILLVGFQNDYFASTGAMHAVVENNVQENEVLGHTVEVLEALRDADVPFVNLPILFSPDYHEIPGATGLMAMIRDAGAFRRDTDGGQVVAELEAFGDRITHLFGKTGFNAFLGTGLDEYLQKEEIEEVVLAGVVTSVCIDSTGRAANERGYSVTVLSDASAGRSEAEHSFYNNDVFPLYAKVETCAEFLDRVSAGAAKA